jgi:hypothetical protein
MARGAITRARVPAAAWMKSSIFMGLCSRGMPNKPQRSTFHDEVIPLIEMSNAQVMSNANFTLIRG